MAPQIFQVLQDNPFDAPLKAGDLVETVQVEDVVQAIMVALVLGDEAEHTLFVRKVDGSDADEVPMGLGWAMPAPSHRQHAETLRAVPAEEVGE